MTTSSPWTRHGHLIPGAAPDDRQPLAIARCGGPALCGSCGEDAAQWQMRQAAQTPESINHGAPFWPGKEATLNERRAAFVYEGARLHADASGAPIVPEPWDLRGSEFRRQFREVIHMMCGPDHKEDPAELHADWVRAYEAMGWQYAPVRDTEARTHPDLVPFEELDPREQSKDAVFILLCTIARLWIT